MVIASLLDAKVMVMGLVQMDLMKLIVLHLPYVVMAFVMLMNQLVILAV